MHFSEPYVNDLVTIKVMEPQKKEDIILSSNQEDESKFNRDVMYLTSVNLSALELLTTLEKSSKCTIDKYLSELSYSNREALFCILCKIDKNLGD